MRSVGVIDTAFESVFEYSVMAFVEIECVFINVNFPTDTAVVLAFVGYAFEVFVVVRITSHCKNHLRKI